MPPSALKSHRASTNQLDARHERGRAIYNFRCYFCHGYSGNAKTLAASFLSPKPRDFTHPDAKLLSRERMINSVTKGVANTAMQAFSNTLSANEIALVVDFVRSEFISQGAVNTRYHTVENGWPNHDRYAIAFPFALGEIAIDTPEHELTAQQQQGKRLFMNSCVTCHDRGRANSEGVVWDAKAVSYPRNRYSHKSTPAVSDTVSSATPYAKHDVLPSIESLNVEEKRGEALFQKNCAFCHAADGTGKNWIGSFLQPHPKNLTDTNNMAKYDRKRLLDTIRNGVPNSTMPAWKGVLSNSEIDDIISYINRAFHPIKP